MNSIIFTHSYHHGNTQKIAEAMAAVLNASVISADTAAVPDVAAYDLVGFGAGIDGGRHYPELLSFAEKLPEAGGKRAFIFSTSAVKGNDPHKALRDILTAKGYHIAGEWSCGGFTTRSVFALVGGKNKDRPNDEDIANAQSFAQKIAGETPS